MRLFFTATILAVLGAGCLERSGREASLGFPAAMPALHPARPSAIPDATLFSLANGRSVLIVEDHALPVVSARVVWRSGAHDEDLENAGISALALEALVSPHSDEAARTRTALDDLGVKIDVRTAWDSSDIGLMTLPSHVDASLGLLARLLTREHLAEPDVLRVQQEHIHTLEQCHDSPSCVAWNHIHGAVLGEEARGAFDPIGRLAALRTFTSAQTDTWRKEHLSLSDAQFVVVGDVKPREIVAYLNRATAATGAASPVAPRDHRSARVTTPGRVQVVQRAGSAQSEVRIGHLCGSFDSPDYAAILVMRQVLGGSYVSRLNQNLRERHGYTYGAGVVLPNQIGEGVGMAAFATQNRTTGLAIDEAVAELSRLASDVVDANELEEARDRARTDLIRKFDTPFNIAKSLAQLAGMNLQPSFFRQLLAKLTRVDAGDVRRATRACFAPDELTIVVVGDEAEIRRAPGRSLLQP